MHIGTLSISWISLIFIVTSGYDDLSANKITQQYKTDSSCPTCVATKAVDRDIHTCTRGEYFGTTSPEKSTWWYVDLGGRYNVFNIRIQFKEYGEMYTMRQRGRFAGFSLYVSNTTDRNSGYLCYKGGPELPPLDFNTNCVTNGRYVVFYNERLVGISYPIGYEAESVFTELCEVTVTGCVRLDVYGSNCGKPCSNNCPEPRCNIFNGACFSCLPGWTGDFCETKCSSGYYGLKCTYKCVGHCKENEPCNHINGTCDNGCLDGWIGVNCNQPSTHTDKFNENCNALFYIAGLSFLILIIIVLVSILLFFIRRYIKLVREMRTLSYATITTTSQQPGNDTKEEHQYQELRIE